MNTRGIYRTVSEVLAGVLACTIVGCAPQDEPRRYKAPKEEVAESAPDTGSRMPSMAPPAGEGLRLTSDTPQGWRPGTGGGMRRAAFVVQDGARKVEISAVDLPARAGALLPNVNRWREQIQLGPMTQDELDKALRPITVAGVEAQFVELVGPEKADARQAILGVVAIRGEKAWFFKMWGDADLALREKGRFEEFVRSVRFETPKKDGFPSVVTGPAGGNSPLEYDAPDGWTPGEAGGLRRVVFDVTEGEQKVEVTVLELPGTVEALLPNVNRWRRQVQLDAITEVELENTVERIQVAGVEGRYVELLGPEDAQRRLAVFRVVISQEGKTWLLSMTGDAVLALREKERFQGFVRSVKFSTPAGAQNGP
jgi:hypothetical protein